MVLKRRFVGLPAGTHGRLWRRLFGTGAAKNHMGKALSAYGPNVMLACGSGSIRKNGIYHEIMETLRGAGKAVTELSGITPNPTYAKVQEGAALAREKKIGFILAADAAQLLSPETLKEIADSRNLIQTGQAQVDHKEIFEILRSCL